MKKIISLVGARPQFIKEAVVGEAVRRHHAWEHVLVHSGQHYDASMSGIFFDDLAIPAPKENLGVGSGTHGAMTGAMLISVEKVLMREKPDALIVYGDTNTTLAGALAAAKLDIPIVHIEAGMRMQPKSMPEELNRVLTDRISTVLCCCSSLGQKNLCAEGITDGVHVTGDVMYDLFLRFEKHFTPQQSAQNLGVEPGHFVVATLHRDFNVDNPTSLAECLRGLAQLQEQSGLAVLFFAHPRTSKNITQFGLEKVAANLRVLSSIGYLELMSLTCASAFVMTDSGGLQKEAYYAGKRAVVIMGDTCWRELVDNGWNILAEACSHDILNAGLRATTPMVPEKSIYGSGQTAERIIQVVRDTLF